MEDDYEVIMAPVVDTEVEAIVAWWRKHRLAARQLFAEEIARALRGLARNPAMGALVESSGRRNRRGVRALLLRRTSYVVLYAVDDAQRHVTVLHVRSASRRPIHRRVKRPR